MTDQITSRNPPTVNRVVPSAWQNADSDEIVEQQQQADGGDLNFSNHMTGRVVLTKLRAIRPKTIAERVILQERIGKVTAKINELEQGLPTIHQIDWRVVNAAKGTAIANGESDRNVELGACIIATEKKSWDGKLYTPRPSTDPIIADAVKTPEFQDCAARLTAALVNYQTEYLPRWSFLHPQSRRHEIKMAIQNPSIDAAQRLDLCREASDLNGEHAQAMCSAETARLNSLYRETVAPLEKELLQIILTAIQQRKTAAIQAEKDFHASQDVEHKATHISTRFDESIRHIQARLNPATRPAIPITGNAVPRDAKNTVLEYVFGIAFNPVALTA